MPADRVALRRFTWSALGLALALTLVLAVRYGPRPLTWAELRPGAAAGGLRLILEQRLPRALIAMLAGASLAVAGALMQAVTRNPLAGPSLMGLGPGAALAMLSSLVLAEPNAFELSLVSFSGAAAGAALVFSVAAAAPKGATPERLVLAGAVVSGLLTSLTGMLVFRLQLAEVLLYWTAGGLGYCSWAQLFAVLPLIGSGLALAWALARPLTLLLAGDERARTLGLRTGAVRGLAALAVLLLAGGAVAVAGPVAFVGIAVPNACRRIAGAPLRRLLPLTALGGAWLVLVSDLVARRFVGSLMDLPLGLLTALVGAPVMVWLVRRGATAA